MCLILLAIEQHPDLPLVVAANRDEFYARPTRDAAFWPEAPQLLAGQDLQQGGTWFGVTRAGRLAMVTNVRRPDDQRGSASRGQLVREFLLAGGSPEASLQQLLTRREEYPGFNLIAGTWDRLYFSSNRGQAQPKRLGPGVHGLSNASLDTPWPKVAGGCRDLAGLLEKVPAAELEPALFALLADDHRAADDELPETGIGLEWERLLSARFIRSAAYGTRCSTLLTVDRQGRVRFVERSFVPGQAGFRDQRFSWTLDAADSPAGTSPTTAVSP